MGAAERADGALKTTGQVAAAGGLYAAGRYNRQLAASTDSPVRRQQAIQRGQQLQAAAGYVAGRNERMGRIIESAHEIRSMARRVRGNTNAAADGFDYMRVGQMQSHYRSNPWLSIGMSQGLQEAYAQMSGRGRQSMRSGDPEAQVAFNSNSGRQAVSDLTQSAENQPPDGGSDLSRSADLVGSSNSSPTATDNTQTIPHAITALGNSDPTVRNQARAAIAATAGIRAARQIDALADQYGQPAVEQTAQHLTGWLANRQQQGATAANILQELQRGDAWTDAVPLSAAEQATVAQTIVQPSRTVSDQTLTAATLAARAAGYSSDATAAWLGSSDTLPDPLTAQLAKLHDAANRLGFSQQQVLAVQADRQQHGAAATRAALIAEGHDPAAVLHLVETVEEMPVQTTISPDLRIERGNLTGFAAARGETVLPLEMGSTQIGNSQERATILAQTVSGMTQQAAPTVQQMAVQTATQLTNTQAAAAIQRITQRVGHTPVQAALRQVSQQVETYRRINGLSDASIVEKFAAPDAEGIRQMQADLGDTPLQRSDLRQLAAATLQPEVVLTRQELAMAITHNAWQPDASPATLADRLQVTDFGKQTAAVRVAATNLATSGLEAVTIQQVVTEIERDNLARANELLQKTKLPRLQTEAQRNAIIATLQQLPTQTRLRRRFVLPTAESNPPDAI
jgi:hypothetical protein